LRWKYVRRLIPLMATINPNLSVTTEELEIGRIIMTDKN
jgi:hypothetical protein